MSWDRFIQHLQDVMIWSLGLACITHFFQMVVYKVRMTDYSMAALVGLMIFSLYFIVVIIFYLIKRRPSND